MLKKIFTTILIFSMLILCIPGVGQAVVYTSNCNRDDNLSPRVSYENGEFINMWSINHALMQCGAKPFTRDLISDSSSSSEESKMQKLLKKYPLIQMIIKANPVQQRQFEITQFLMSSPQSVRLQNLKLFCSQLLVLLGNDPTQGVTFKTKVPTILERFLSNDKYDQINFVKGFIQGSLKLQCS